MYTYKDQEECVDFQNDIVKCVEYALHKLSPRGYHHQRQIADSRPGEDYMRRSAPKALSAPLAVGELMLSCRPTAYFILMAEQPDGPSKTVACISKYPVEQAD